MRYLVEGSVRKAGPRVRITAQLIEASSGAHLWADRYDRELDDIFSVQDEVVAQIAATLIGRIEAANLEQAQRKPTAATSPPTTWSCRAWTGSPPTAPANAAARRLFEAAVARDPAYAIAHAYLALAIFNQDWSASPTPAWTAAWSMRNARCCSTGRTACATGFLLWRCCRRANLTVPSFTRSAASR